MHSKHVSLNRIKIQVILLILETDYFSKLFISEMLHPKQWHYSLHRDFQNCYSTRRSPTGFFSSNSSSNSTRVPIQYTSSIHVHTPENSPSRIQFHMQKTKSSSSTTTTYRGQRDLHSRKEILEIHLCVLQDLPRTFQAFQLQDLLKAFQTFQTFQSFQSFQTFQSFMTFQPFQAILQVPVPPGFPPHYSILQLECIFYIFYKFYSSIGFHRKLHQVPVEQYKLQTFYKHYILQRKGDVVIWVMSEMSEILPICQ